MRYPSNNFRQFLQNSYNIPTDFIGILSEIPTILSLPTISKTRNIVGYLSGYPNKYSRLMHHEGGMGC